VPEAAAVQQIRSEIPQSWENRNVVLCMTAHVKKKQLRETADKEAAVRFR